MQTPGSGSCHWGQNAPLAAPFAPAARAFGAARRLLRSCGRGAIVYVALDGTERFPVRSHVTIWRARPGPTRRTARHQLPPRGTAKFNQLAEVFNARIF